jgi:hypothetical protein
LVSSTAAFWSPLMIASASAFKSAMFVHLITNINLIRFILLNNQSGN